MRQRIADLIYRWLGHYDMNHRSTRMPSVPAQGLSMRFGDHDPDLDPPGPMLVASTLNDGYELWLGYFDKWQIHFGRKDARRLAWFILLNWWAAGEWFGLRRALWYWALGQRLKGYPKNRPVDQPSERKAV